jgi:antitoxin CcdA
MKNVAATRRRGRGRLLYIAKTVFTVKFVALGYYAQYNMCIINAYKESVMQMHVFNPDAPKKATNLSINSDLLRLAREERINLSRTLEQRLEEIIVEIKRQQWQEENRAAIDDYNRRIEAEGVFSEGLRSF